MNPVMEYQILEGFKEALEGREAPTVQVMNIQPIDAKYDITDVTDNNPFPAITIHPGDSELLEDNSNKLRIGFEVRCELTLLQQTIDLPLAYTIVAKHVVERIMFHRTRRHIQGADQGDPFDLRFIQDIQPAGSTTVARDPNAATQTFTREFVFTVIYDTTYEEIRKYVPTG